MEFLQKLGSIEGKDKKTVYTLFCVLTITWAVISITFTMKDKKDFFEKDWRKDTIKWLSLAVVAMTVVVSYNLSPSEKTDAIYMGLLGVIALSASISTSYFWNEPLYDDWRRQYILYMSFIVGGGTLLFITGYIGKGKIAPAFKNRIQALRERLLKKREETRQDI